jgi:hypothetical protein
MSDDHPKLAALRQAMHEVATDPQAAGIRITVERCISFGGTTITHGLRIERERTTASGRQGKPEPILRLVNNPDQSPVDMLRDLADLLAQHDEDEIESGGAA